MNRLRPIDIPTSETVDFIQTHVRRGGHILEVGCGDGEVASALAKQGYRVTALDSDPERIAKARKLGLDAVVGSWPDFHIDAVDAIVFTRSLHHIDPLGPAVKRARALLKQNGVLLVEDFAVEAVNEQTLEWFLIYSEPISPRFETHSGSFVTELCAAKDPMKVWQAHHAAHAVHPYRALHLEITGNFSACSVEPVPYFYRYLVSSLPETGDAAKLVRECLKSELQAAAKNAISLIGRRMVATL